MATNFSPESVLVVGRKYVIANNGNDTKAAGYFGKTCKLLSVKGTNCNLSLAKDECITINVRSLFRSLTLEPYSSRKGELVGSFVAINTSGVKDLPAGTVAKVIAHVIDPVNDNKSTYTLVLNDLPGAEQHSVLCTSTFRLRVKAVETGVKTFPAKAELVENLLKSEHTPESPKVELWYDLFGGSHKELRHALSINTQFNAVYNLLGERGMLKG